MRLRLGALAATAVFLIAACGAAPGGTGGGGTPAACANKKGTSSTEIHVYSSLPRQGTNTEQTDTLVEQIRNVLEGQKIGNFSITYTDLDDSSAAAGGDWDGAVAQANANRAAADPDAMVFIGHYNSGAAKLTIPILNQACLVMISPANTYPGLSKAVPDVTEAGEPDKYYPGGYRNYTRVITTDDKQGAAGAEWAKRLGATKVYVLDDTQVYGAGLAKAFALHANKIGIEVLGANKKSEGFDAKATDYNALAQKVKAAGADFIYVGSITGQNTGKLWKDLRAAMPDVTIMSGDGVFEKSWYDGAGTAGNGTYLTFGGVGPDQLTGAGKTWFEEYKTAHGGNQPSTYTAYGNAAATVALEALKKAGTNDRYEVLKAVFATKDLDTVLGKMGFDANGDTTNIALTGYQVETSWPPTFKEQFATPQ
ncbi:MAG TPA: branched-chain amino acid ABC transporter substrate-binding protein [Candidatus Limnocylindrales bacterium]|jgi:branched-chain amino acid transport system substrate-binding protein|nr:branched-chain amino acid ABC transporter substrate-binding protein [Candidatus Limnocylindrales bacterium]